jgi:uncharacterized protein (TIGR03437 family)
MRQIARNSLLLLVAAVPLFAQSAALVATYNFQNSVAPSQGAASPLNVLNPTGNNAYITDTVLGQPRTVLQLASSRPSQNAGFSVSTVNLLNPLSYSVEMLFTFTEGAGTFRRVLDVLDRTSDRGLYINNNGKFDFSRLASVSNFTLTNGSYVHMVMVVNDNRAILYLNGNADNNLSTNSMNLTTANRTLTFFLDNLQDTSPNEFASARVALLRLYSNPLTAAEARQLATSPFNSTVGIGPPSFQTNGVRNGATFSESTPLAPGAFFSIFGSSLSDNVGDWSGAFTGVNAPTTLNGTRILLNNTPAFLSFTSPGQVNAIVPGSIAPGPVSVIVERNGVRSTPVTAQARALNPAFFTYDQRNRRFIAALAADNSAFIAPADLFGVSSINGLAVRPARPGDFIVAYGMGFGATVPDVAPGTIPAPRDGGYPIAAGSTLRLGSRTIPTLYTGLSSFAGVYIVGFQVPADFSPGDYELQITVNGIASPTGVVIPVVR